MPAANPFLAIALVLTQVGAIGLAWGETRAESDTPDPSFSRHIVPILSKLGCNAGTCHGAVQGKNGFRLSLFGADTQADFTQLVYGVAGRRINLIEPDKSLFLLKAMQRIPHEGGKLIEKGGYEHEMLIRWIAAGAPRDDAGKPNWRVEVLRVTPSEQVIEPGKSYPSLATRLHSTATSESDHARQPYRHFQPTRSSATCKAMAPPAPSAGAIRCRAPATATSQATAARTR